MNYLERLAKLIKEEKAIKKEIEDIKKYCIEGYLNNENFILENEDIKLSIIPESSAKSIDLTAIKKNEAQLYSELLDVYPKITTRKAYIKASLR